DAFAEILHESMLALDIDTKSEIADHRSLDDPRHLILNGLLLRDVRQLDDIADASLLAHHRSDHELEVAPADTVLRARDGHEILKARALTVRVLVEKKHALTGELASVEMRYLLADVGLDRFQQRAQAFVQIDDLAVRSDDHHIAADAVDGAFDPRHLRTGAGIDLDGARRRADLVLLLRRGDLDAGLVIGQPGHRVRDARERRQDRAPRRPRECDDHE